MYLSAIKSPLHGAAIISTSGCSCNTAVEHGSVSEANRAFAGKCRA